MEWLWPAKQKTQANPVSPPSKTKKSRRKHTHKRRDGEKGEREGISESEPGAAASIAVNHEGFSLEMEEKFDPHVASRDPSQTSDESSDFEATLASFDTLEEEIDFLRKQNKALHARVQRQATCIQRATGLSPRELSIRVQAKIPEFIKRVDRESNPNVLFLPSEIEGEVGVIEKSTIDWWSLVDLEKQPSNDLTSGAGKDELVFTDTRGLSGPFVYLSEESITDAIAYFVAQCVVATPECNALSDDELMKMLDTTFDNLREKGTFEKMKDWATFLYSIYGYAGYAWVIYENPYVAQMVTTCVWSALAFLVL